jgi:hypothetical protein
MKRGTVLRNISIAAALLLAGVNCSGALADQSSLPVAGWLEYATLPSGLKLHAKLDTGAETSSINAVDMEPFMRDDDDWIRFSLTDLKGRKVTLERAVVRTATIKRHFGEKQQRAVVNLEICVGSIKHYTEVSLIDRAGLNYPLLIGRNFLGNALLVDSGHTYLLPTDCTAP